MSAIIDAFKIKPFDLEPIYASWSSPPIFHGQPNGPPVDTWLEEIKSGCKERKVPKEYWPKVAQRYLGPKAKGRVDEVKLVMAKVHGGKYRWNWKRFKIAMRNLGWDIDPKETEGIKVATRPSGLWWIIGKEKDASQSPPHIPGSEQKSEAASLTKPLPPTPEMKEQQSSWFTRSPPAPKRNNSSASQTLAPITPPTPDVTVVKQVPTWLLNACNALDFLTVEHPKAMSTLSAVLITVGSLPALPVIAAGAGGTVLASHAVQAAGAIAIGLGNWLKVAQENSQHQHQQQQQRLGLGQGSIEECAEK